MVAVELPTSLNETVADIAASFAALEVEEGSVEVEVTQTWSHTLSSAADTNKAMLVAKVLETCEAVSPGCRVSLVSSRERRALATSGGTGTGGHHHEVRKLSTQADVRVVRTISGTTRSTAAVPLPTNVTATSSSLVAVDARMTVVVQSGDRAGAQALSSSLTAESVAAQLSTDLGIRPKPNTTSGGRFRPNVPTKAASTAPFIAAAATLADASPQRERRSTRHCRRREL